MSDITISLCMIVKNEEKTLEKCLSSVQNIVNEIIIVDTGSNDSTVDIARYFGAKVFTYEWINDFSAVRNFSISKATSHYILVLDADEYLESGTDLKKEAASKADYYIVNIKNYSSNGVNFFHQAIRLFKNHIGLSYFGKLHEHLNIMDSKLNLREETASFLIYHTGYLNEVIVEKNKYTRNFDIIVKDAEVNPTPYNLFNLGSSYFSRNDYEKALEYFKRSYVLKSNVSYVYPLLSRMIESLRLLKRFPDAITLASDAINRYPAYTDFYFLLGRVYEDYGYFRDAELLYQKCIQIGDVKEVGFTIAGVGGYLSYFHLAGLYLKQNRFEEAFDAAYESIQMNKHFFPSLRSYFEIMLKARVSKQDVLSHLENVYPIQFLQDIKTIFMALYATRHPLLNYYISQTNVRMNPEITMTAKLYECQYDESVSECLTLENIDQANTVDLLLLAVLSGNTDLLDKYKSVFNLRQKEWNFIKRLITKQQTINYKATPWTEEMLLTLCERLIILSEFDVFEYVTDFILRGTQEAQFNLAKILGDYGFHDAACDLLYKLQLNDPNSLEVILLLGDLNYNLRRFEEAESYYAKYVDFCKVYPGYERLYQVYEKTQNTREMHQIKQEIARLFPLCRWVHLN